MHNHIPKPSQNGHAVGCNGQPTKTTVKARSQTVPEEYTKAIPNSCRECRTVVLLEGTNSVGATRLPGGWAACDTAFLDAVSADDVAAVAPQVWPLLPRLATLPLLPCTCPTPSGSLSPPEWNPDTLDLNEIRPLAPTLHLPGRGVLAVLLDGVDPANCQPQSCVVSQQTATLKM